MFVKLTYWLAVLCSFLLSLGNIFTAANSGYTLFSVKLCEVQEAYICPSCTTWGDTMNENYSTFGSVPFFFSTGEKGNNLHTGVIVVNCRHTAKCSLGPNKDDEYCDFNSGCQKTPINGQLPGCTPITKDEPTDVPAVYHLWTTGNEI